MDSKLIYFFLLFTGLACIDSSKVKAQSFFTSFDGTRIAYSDEGSGTPILLIHGFINTHKNWDHTQLKKDLISSGFRVIAPSLRGNGESDKPQDESAYANNAEIRDLKLLMRYLGVDHYYALGYSRGAILLAQLLTEDKRIEKAVIGGMGKDFTNPDWDRRVMFMHAFLGTQALNSQTEGAVNYAKSQNADLKALGYSQKYQPAAKVKKLQKVRIPVFIIAGDRDRDNGNPAELAAVFPNAQLKLVPGVHNTAHTTGPFAKEVLTFLEKN